MLFDQRFWESIAAGAVTVTFRRWKRRQAVAGNRQRTLAGIIQVTAVGRERLPFKEDVRKLKNLGLTISLGVGYRLSPRGEAFLACGGT